MRDCVNSSMRATATFLDPPGGWLERFRAIARDEFFDGEFLCHWVTRIFLYGESFFSHIENQIKGMFVEESKKKIYFFLSKVELEISSRVLSTISRRERKL